MVCDRVEGRVCFFSASSGSGPGVSSGAGRLLEGKGGFVSSTSGGDAGSVRTGVGMLLEGSVLSSRKLLTGFDGDGSLVEIHCFVSRRLEGWQFGWRSIVKLSEFFN